jgi:uncharacterized protein (DUF433 family)
MTLLTLNHESSGTIRIGSTRVTLDTLVVAHNRGENITEIHEGFPTLSQDEIRLTIEWYLNNRVEVDNYLAVREAGATELYSDTTTT